MRRKQQIESYEAFEKLRNKIEQRNVLPKTAVTNWMSTVGININEVERITCEKIGCRYAVALSAGTAALHMAMKLAGQDLYGQPDVGHGALEGKRVITV